MSERLFDKYDVRRNDGRDRQGDKHYGDTYFVLDLNHDPAAMVALAAYAGAVAKSQPELAADLLSLVCWGLGGDE